MPFSFLFSLQEYLDAPPAHFEREKEKEVHALLPYCSLRDGGWSPRFFQGERNRERERERGRERERERQRGSDGHLHSEYSTSRGGWMATLCLFHRESGKESERERERERARERRKVIQLGEKLDRDKQ